MFNITVLIKSILGYIEYFFVGGNVNDASGSLFTIIRLYTHSLTDQNGKEPIFSIVKLKTLARLMIAGLL